MFFNLLGWVGMVLVLFAYYLVSSKRTVSRSTLYQTLNLIGALSLGVYAFVLHAWVYLALNVIWALIAIQALHSDRSGGKGGK